MDDPELIPKVVVDLVEINQETDAATVTHDVLLKQKEVIDIKEDNGELNLGVETVSVEHNDPTKATEETKAKGDLGQESEAKDDGVDSSEICSELAIRLSVGNTVDDLNQCYLLYCEYARLCGFSVRKGDNHYFNGTKVIRAKELSCSCEGIHDAKKSTGTMPAFKRQNTRSNCKARIRFVRDTQNSFWKVQRFEVDHNHELAPIHQSYMLRSARNLSHAQKSLVEAMNSAGIGVSRACRFFEKESGGPENIGFTRKDIYNHITSHKLQTNVENVDANALVKYFVQQSNKEPYFYWNTQLDDDGRLMNFFFRDSRCLIDYEHFGDVLSVDTTYKTNKYDLICAPFVGINHHMKNVMFGLAFLSNESTRSFEWLFQTFLESMHGKEPVTIFSDQGGSLVNGINSCFRTAKHRLCQWHISKNAPSHFGSLNGNSEFKRQWYYCMKQADDVADFEHCWQSMISTYHLENHRWFAVMYKLRARWATAFTNDCFSAGLLATSRSEVTNKVMKDLCSKASSLFEFVQGYQQTVTDWRTKENADDFFNIGNPGLHVTNNMLLVQISKVLTRAVFLKFADQSSQQISVIIIERPPPNCNDADVEFKVASQNSMTRIRRVQYNRASHMVSCSCRMWETSGVIYRHIFRVYLDMNVTRFPDYYLLPRWCKSAKHRHPNVCGNYSNDVGENVVDDMSFVNYAVRLQYSLAEHAKRDTTWKKKVLAATLKLKNEVFAGLGNLNSTTSNDVVEQDDDALHLRDPPRKRSKQVSVSHWNKKKPKRNAKKPTKQAGEGCSQQSVSNATSTNISVDEASLTDKDDEDGEVGRAVWDTYNELMCQSLDHDLDKPIDVTSIFQGGINSNDNTCNSQRFVI